MFILTHWWVSLDSILLNSPIIIAQERMNLDCQNDFVWMMADQGWKAQASISNDKFLSYLEEVTSNYDLENII